MRRTCGRKQRPGKVLWIMEAWKHSRGRRSAEQVKFTTYLDLVGIQLHLLYLLLVMVDLPGDLYMNCTPLPGFSYWWPVRV